eukprot:scaffold4851_cov428-Prasinococcus_capsulatus_cf.AAC.11
MHRPPQRCTELAARAAARPRRPFSRSGQEAETARTRAASTGDTSSSGRGRPHRQWATAAALSRGRTRPLGTRRLQPTRRPGLRTTLQKFRYSDAFPPTPPCSPPCGGVVWAIL